LGKKNRKKGQQPGRKSRGKQEKKRTMGKTEEAKGEHRIFGIFWAEKRFKNFRRGVMEDRGGGNRGRLDWGMREGGEEKWLGRPERGKNEFWGVWISWTRVRSNLG